MLTAGAHVVQDGAFFQVQKNSTRLYMFPNDGLMYQMPELAMPRVDGGFPYKGRSFTFPGKGRMTDGPNASIYYFGWWGWLAYYSTTFETCVVCLEGIEGPTTESRQYQVPIYGGESVWYSNVTSTRPTGLTTYGCFSWQLTWSFTNANTGASGRLALEPTLSNTAPISVADTTGDVLTELYFRDSTETPAQAPSNSFWEAIEQHFSWW